MTKVSICIPTYNNLNAFKRCLSSVLIQDFRDFEIIITDDSNNDDIFSYVNQIDFQNIQFQYFRNKSPLKSPGNWNSAISFAKGEYVKLMHHDDWFTNESSLKIFVDLLDSNPNAILGFVSSKNINIENNSLININSPSKEWLDNIKKTPLELVNNNFIGSPSAVIHRNNTNCEYDLKLKWFVDVDFYVNLLKTTNMEIVFNPIDAISIGISKDQISRECENNPNVIVFEFFYYLNKWKIFSVFENNQILKIALEIFKKFNITKIEKIRYFGYTGKLPKGLNKIFFNFFIIKYKAKIYWYFSRIKRKLRKIIST